MSEATGSIAERLAEAARLHRAGSLDEAGALYEQVLAAHPENVDALHLSGLVAVARGRAGAGLARVCRALELAPGLADAWRNLGLALRSLGEREGAVAALRAAAERDPEDPDLQRLLGTALREAGRADEGRAVLEAAAARMPGDADLLLALASALEHAGRRGEAIRHLREVAFLRPDQADSHLLLGQMLRAEGMVDDAIASLRAARGLDPWRAHIALALADALHHQRRDGEAIAHAEAARELDPLHPGAAALEIGILTDLRSLPEALARADAALARFPGEPALHSARGLALMAAGRMEEAVAAATEAVALAPEDAGARLNLAAIVGHAGEPERALDIYLEAERLAPGSPALLANRGMTRLLLGDYETGFREYEARFAAQRPEERRRDITAPRLTPGTDIEGRTVLVHAEQGFGDNIQFARFVPMLAARGARVALEVPPGLGRLMGSVEGVFHVAEQGVRLPAHDYAIPVMSLAWFLGVTLDNLPATVPYLAPPEEVQARWDRLLGTALPERPRIGIAWSGNPNFAGFATRSIPFAVLNRIRAARPEAKFVVLQTQYDEGTEREIEEADNLVVARAAIRDFADTAALINRLDLVIAGDTSLVHLAGALGRPAWVLLQRAADWRWLAAREDSPWYPSLRLFRQERHGDWDGVVAAAAAALAQHRFEI